MIGRKLRIGITCFPSTGGSGVVATELGLSLARRGHSVHFICYDVPPRLAAAQKRPRPGWANLHFHRVEIGDYPLPHLDPYPLALATRLAEISVQEKLDLLHVHYAVPHATSAYLARQLLLSQGRRVPRVVATLHGTDITLVGSSPALLPMNRFSLQHCDGLTAPSRFLLQAAYERLQLPASIPFEVIPNFVDTAHFRPASKNDAARRATEAPVLIHGSNFRPLKRIDDVVHIFAGVKQVIPCQLLLLGDGPERPRIEALVHSLGLTDSVRFLGMQVELLRVLQSGDVFLLPSATEGFGLAALEALSCGVPVVASRVGGIPEVVADGKSGFLCEPGDVPAMTQAVLRLLQTPKLREHMGKAARKSTLLHWQKEPMVTRYEGFYERVLGLPTLSSESAIESAAKF